ncbi:MAG: nuclear transport factor 2 family protein [Bacteroidetes bacterium]|nr:nuclear transport factor 2 family protein [Bacteroidota bacterium]
MRRRCFLYLLCAATIGCGRTFTPADEAAIRHVMADQEQAWDRGDIPGFMDGYADSVCFIGKKGSTCGKAAVTANYQRSYPDRAAMGDLTFDRLEVLPGGADHAWCTGRWQLVRAADTLGGGFSLFWEREAEGWRILRDHTY